MSDVANCAFDESASLVISGPLDTDRFVQAVITVLAEQEAFYYRFDSDGEPQWVDERAIFELPITDWSEPDEVNRTARLDAWIDQQSLTPFDLERGPLVRPQLFKPARRLHLFAIYCHHIIFDGFSSEILLRKITGAYSLVKDLACVSFSIVPYSVYVERAALIDRDESAASLAYWCSEFEGSVPPPLELPTDRPGVDGSIGATSSLT